MSSSVPAWKRAGLKHSNKATSQAKAAYDPLKEGLKRAGESDKKPAKPAKKQKVAKADKPAPTHELDQLAYLRQYTEDRDAWKFSKQKQNWLLKRLFTEAIGDKYEEPLTVYIKGIQGSARSWVIEDALNYVNKWNSLVRTQKEKDLEEKLEMEQKDEEAEDASQEAEPKQNEAKDEKKPLKKETKKEIKEETPSHKMAVRAKILLVALENEGPEIETFE